jgi:hypothetical protein
MPNRNRRSSQGAARLNVMLSLTRAERSTFEALAASELRTPGQMTTRIVARHVSELAADPSARQIPPGERTACAFRSASPPLSAASSSDGRERMAGASATLRPCSRCRRADVRRAAGERRRRGCRLRSSRPAGHGRGPLDPDTSLSRRAAANGVRSNSVSENCVVRERPPPRPVTVRGNVRLGCLRFQTEAKEHADRAARMAP